MKLAEILLAAFFTFLVLAAVTALIGCTTTRVMKKCQAIDSTFYKCEEP